MKFAAKGLPMTAGAMDKLCELLNVGEPEIWAVLSVETHGFGYLRDRRPQILFERHVFSKRTAAKHDKKHPNVSGPRGGYQGGAAEYDRLAAAMALNEEEALKSASWGLAQVMGFNHRVVGADTVHAMVEKFVESEDNQLEALGNFIMAHAKCRIGMQRRDWASFAACYNGPDFRRNDYDNRLAAAFEKARRMLPDIGLRRAQVALFYLGFEPGAIDGLRGRRTRGAIGDFQAKKKLPVTGELDERTGNLLEEAAFGS